MLLGVLRVVDQKAPPRPLWGGPAETELVEELTIVRLASIRGSQGSALPGGSRRAMLFADLKRKRDKVPLARYSGLIQIKGSRRRGSACASSTIQVSLQPPRLEEFTNHGNRAAGRHG